jgi:hypothetical protein
MQQGMFLQLQWHPAARDDAKKQKQAVAFTMVAAVAAAKAQASRRLGRRHAVAETLAFTMVAAVYHQAMMIRRLGRLMITTTALMKAAAAVTLPRGIKCTRSRFCIGRSIIAIQPSTAMYHQAMMMRAAAAVAFAVVAAMYHRAMMMKAAAAAVVQAAPAVTATVMMKAQAMLRLGRRHTVPSQATSLRVVGLGGLLLGHLLELWIRTIFALSVAKNPALWHFFIKVSVEGTTSTCVCVKAVLDTAPEANH